MSVRTEQVPLDPADLGEGGPNGQGTTTWKNQHDHSPGNISDTNKRKHATVYTGRLLLCKKREKRNKGMLLRTCIGVTSNKTRERHIRHRGAWGEGQQGGTETRLLL